MIWKELVQHARAWLAEYGWRVLAALAILVLGLLFASAIRRLLWTALRARAVGGRRLHSLPQIGWLAVVLLTFTLVLVALGLAGPVIGFIVTVGLGLGLFADSFSGLRILVTQPFRVGDLIEIKGEDVTGTVVQISIGDIILRTAENTEVIVPNRKLLDSLIINHSPSSAQTLVCFEFVLDLIPGIDALEKQIRAIMKAMPGIGSGNGKQVSVTAIEGNSVTFKIHFPTPPFEAERLASEFLKAAKTHFDQVGVAIRSLSANPESGQER